MQYLATLWCLLILLLLAVLLLLHLPDFDFGTNYANLVACNTIEHDKHDEDDADGNGVAYELVSLKLLQQVYF